MKKILAVLLCAVMVFSLVACSAQNEQSTAVSGSPAEESAPPESSAEPTERPEEPSEPTPAETAPETTPEAETAEGKTLVVYFSATNHTETVAGYIAEATGGDLFELIPVEPYTAENLDWTDRESRVSLEHDDESLRDVELTNAVPDNWDEYDTVFIGYPIWWGIAAWPTDTFVKANDFTGKTVIPFCTSSSSGLGQSGELLKEEATSGDWLEGQRFQSSASEDTVKEWVAGLGL